MATYDASIRRARRSQDDLKEDGEHCSADPERLASIGRARGQQVRIRRDEREYALYTVSELRPEHPDARVRMGPAGRARLDAEGEFAAVVDSRVPHPTKSEADAEAEAELVERLRDDGRQTRLIAIAPHGGAIEPFTDEQAERVRSRLGAGAASAWRCKGWGGARGAHERWHITSTDIDEASFPRLRSVISRGFTHAVAFHGLLDEEILIGGRGPTALKREIGSEIERATAGSGIPVRIAKRGDPSNGNHRRNIVNRLTADGESGIQIEQGPQARCHHWRAIADAVAEVYRRRL
jgi:phage replication-related protein YjqB (UPF0714/DUF867 family)